MPLPLVIGAALTAPSLPAYLPWLLEHQRDLEIQDPAYPQFLDGDWRPQAREIRAMLDGYTGRLGIHAPFFSLSIAVYDSKVRAATIERYLESLDFAAEIGATHMVLHSPLQFLGAPLLGQVNSEEADYFRQAYAQTMLPLIQRASDIGCTLVIENIFDRQPTLWRMLVAELNSASVRLSLDVGHAYIAYAEGAPAPDQWALVGSDLLAHVHLQDTDGYGDRHWAAGDGNLRWRSLFEALASLPTTPRLILEMAKPDDVARSAAWLVAQGLAI